ncbi:Sodium-dependent phosphate transporter 1-B(Solute carrier family 20 member 1-B) [Rickettsia prowazekii str. Rp22]|uniref:Sodium-dependent phosphate transporter 1-B(Solute carrier family 20 member 1-B) n=1 Tax=Rickettsia prowazekii (strain Rp22) TaxID=449216 RepID=D5AWD9_RICPP|nr:Sodium-dependent phosphate transporter 1-B(Solute carrier family 20 member 1-B) [Rickettsia prowazekii str. Rp22]
MWQWFIILWLSGLLSTLLLTYIVKLVLRMIF